MHDIFLSLFLAFILTNFLGQFRVFFKHTKNVKFMKAKYGNFLYLYRKFRANWLPLTTNTVYTSTCNVEKASYSVHMSKKITAETSTPYHLQYLNSNSLLEKIQDGFPLCDVHKKMLNKWKFTVIKYFLQCTFILSIHFFAKKKLKAENKSLKLKSSLQIL